MTGPTLLLVSSLHSKGIVLFFNKLLGCLVMMPWSYWIISRLCDFVICLKEKVISILRTLKTSFGESNGSWEPVDAEAAKMTRAQPRLSCEACREPTTDGTWGRSWNFWWIEPKIRTSHLCIIARWHKEVSEDKQLVVSELLLVFLPVVMVCPSEIG